MNRIYTRKNTITGEEVRMSEMNGVYYVHQGMRQLMNSDDKGAAYRAYNGVERGVI